jgi:hypothetical protein
MRLLSPFLFDVIYSLYMASVIAIKVAYRHKNDKKNKSRSSPRASTCVTCDHTAPIAKTRLKMPIQFSSGSSAVYAPSEAASTGVD